MFRRSSVALPTSREGRTRLLLCVLGELVVDGPHIADRTATLVLRAARPDPCLDVAMQLTEHRPSIAVVLPVDFHAPLHYFEKGGTIHSCVTSLSCVAKKFDSPKSGCTCFIKRV